MHDSFPNSNRMQHIVDEGSFIMAFYKVLYRKRYSAQLTFEMVIALNLQ